MPNVPDELLRLLDFLSVFANRRGPVSTVDLWRAVPAQGRAIDAAPSDGDVATRSPGAPSEAPATRS